MYRIFNKRCVIIPVLIAVLVMTFSNTAFAETGSDISQLLKKFMDSDNPIDNLILNSDTNILTDNMDTLDNALKLIYSEPAVSYNYDKICPLFYMSNITGIKMFVDGRLVEFSKYDNVNPAILDGRVFVPVRAMAENLGAVVNWDEETGLIEIELYDNVLEVTLNSEYAYINGNQVIMDAPAREIDGRVLVPVRFISEAFSKTVEWHAYDESLNVIAIY